MTALTIAPQAIFASDITAQSSDTERTLPVGGWTPEELEVVNDPEVVNASELPTLRRGTFTSDPDSVFTKGVSTVGYDALTTDAERNYYKALEKEAIAFMNAKEDLQGTEMQTTAGTSIKYVIAQLMFDDYGIQNYEEASHAYYAFDYDHPAYYWISNSVLSSGKYFYLCTDEEYASVDERARINSLVDSGVKEYIAKAENGSDTLDKVAMVHDQIETAVDYAYQDDGKTAVKAKWAHSVHGVFDKTLSKVVCEGYADAFALIMNYMGIPNYYIVGSEGQKGGGHVWNAVSVNDGESYLYLDLTWDDRGKDGYSYEYFGMPATDFEDYHYKYTPNLKRNRWLYPVEVNISDDVSDTYYRQAGFYCDSTGNKMNETVARGKIKAGRAGSHVSFMVPAMNLIVSTALSTSLGKNKSITVSYRNTSYKVIISKVSNKKVDLSSADISLSDTAYAYTGGPVEPKPVVTCNGFTLIEGDNYTVSYDNNIETGESARLTVTGTGNFTGSASANFTIYKSAHVHNMIAHPAVDATSTEAGNSAYWYCDGCEKYFADEDGSTEIKEGSWVIDPIGHEQTPETIVPELSLSSAALTYNGKDQAPDVTVKHGNQILKEGTDYIIERKPSAAVGTYTLQVTMKNAYSGSAKATYKIIPKGTKITRLQKGRKKMTVKWKKQSKQVTGYQICYSQKKNFRSGTKKVTVKNAKKVRKVIKKLKSRKTYYVRIRTYKKIGSQYYYSAWSKTRSVKIK